jgi:hypothetical protein
LAGNDDCQIATARGHGATGVQHGGEFGTNVSPECGINFLEEQQSGVLRMHLH